MDKVSFGLAFLLLLASTPSSQDTLVVGRVEVETPISCLERDPASNGFLAIGEDGALLRVLLDSGVTSVLGDTGVPTIDSLTLDEGLGTLYGLASDTLYAIDPEDGATTVIGALDATDVRAIAFDDASRTLYALQQALGYTGYGEAPYLLEIDEQTGATTTLGELSGHQYTAFTALAFDETTGSLYGWHTRGPGSGLVRIDTTSVTFDALGGGSRPISSLAFDANTGELIGVESTRYTNGPLGVLPLKIDRANGGATPIPVAGADFQQLGPALDAASPGDTVLVLRGDYGLATLDKGLRVLGDPAAVPAVGWNVTGLPAGEVVALSHFRNFLGVENCEGVVVATSLDVAKTSLGNSVDVRLHGGRVDEQRGPYFFPGCTLYTNGGSGARVYASRLEVVSATVIGGAGPCGHDCISGSSWCGRGGPGIEAIGASRVHTAWTDLQGGPENSPRGQGYPYLRGWYSEFTFEPEPILEVAASESAPPFELVVHGAPASRVTLSVGTPRTPTPGVLLPVELLVDPIDVFDGGVLDTNGDGVVPVTPAPWWPDDVVLLAQVETTDPDGEVLLSNSAALPPLRSFAHRLASALLRNVRDEVLALPAGAVTTPGHAQALASFLSQAADRIDRGDVPGAMLALQHVTERADGCLLRGSPDSRHPGPGPAWDWVQTCEDQAAIADVLQHVIDRLGPTPTTPTRRGKKALR